MEELTELNIIKGAISRQTGVPVNLLTGTTEEDITAQAKILEAFKKEPAEHPQQAQENLTEAEQFARYFDGQLGIKREIPAAELAQPMPNYPTVKDGGEELNMARNDSRPAAEKFAEWFADKTAFNPFMSSDGWINLT